MNAAVKYSLLFQFAFWSAIAFTALMASVPHPPPLAANLDDKILHAFAFAGLAALAIFAFPRIRLMAVLIALALFGGIVELVQATPSVGRNPSWFDWGADIVGIGLMLFFVASVRWLQMRKL